jgi:hypothetical protein
MKFKFALVCAIGLASVNAMACYTVYDRDNQVVYNAQTAPVDMSRPIHETLPSRFPGATMVFGPGTDCPREQPAKLMPIVAPARPSPLLTDRRTAEAMHLKHTLLPSGIALVGQPPAVMTAGISVFPSATQVPEIAAPVLAQRSAASRPETVITELHNPPLTIVQQGGLVISER